MAQIREPRHERLVLCRLLKGRTIMTKMKPLSKAQKETLRFLLEGGYRISTASPTLAILCERGLISITVPEAGSVHGYWVRLTDYGRKIAEPIKA